MKKRFFIKKGVEVIFIPDTAYQLIQLHVREHDPNLQEKFERFWMRIKNESVAQSILEHDQATTQDYFYRLNDAVVRFLEAKKFQFKDQSIDQLKALLPTQQFPTEVKTILKSAVDSESKAFKDQKVLLWRFTNGVPNHPGWVDSILDMSSPQIAKVVAHPKLFKSRALHANGLSFGRTLLDGYVRDGRVLEDPIEEYDSLGAPACSMSYLLAGLNHRKLIDLFYLALKEFVDVNGAVLSKEDIERIHAHRNSRTLYFLSLSESELQKFEKFFMDPTDKNKFYLGLLGSGERFHYWLFLQEKVLDKPDIHQWGANHLIGEGSESESTDSQKPHSQNQLKTQKHLIEEYFKMMASKMHIVYTHHRVIEDESQDIDSRKILENYKTFYRAHVPEILRNFKFAS